MNIKASLTHVMEMKYLPHFWTKTSYFSIYHTRESDGEIHRKQICTPGSRYLYTEVDQIQSSLAENE